MQLILSLFEKLSYKKLAHKALIRLGLLPYILLLLKDYESHSMPVLEGATTTLLNLLLTRQGRQACSDMSLKALETVSLVADVDSSAVRANVNAALYSLLSVPEQRAEAKVLDL